MCSPAISKRFLPVFFLVSLSLLGFSSPGAAKIADPTKSSHDAVLVGDSSGNPVGDGYHVVVRDVGSIPLPGCFVSVIFESGTSRPYSEQESGTTVDCGQDLITRITDGDGAVVFHPRIAGFDNSGAVQIRANGVLLGVTLVRSTDLDGNGSTDIRDLNLFRERFFFDRNAPETDFNQDGITNGFDLERLREEILTRALGTPCP